MTSELQMAMSSMVSFMTIAKGAIDARDWSKLGDLSAKFQEQIIKTQQSVIDAQAAQSDLVAKLAKANEKIRELETSLAEQARHTLEEIVPGKFALRVDLPRQDEKNLSLNSASQTIRYACQRCFAVTGKSIILQHTAAGEWRCASYICPACKYVLEL